MGLKLDMMIIVLAILLGGIGCSTPKNSGYLADYQRLEKGSYLERSFIDEKAIAAADVGPIVLAGVSADAIQGRKGVTKAQCEGWLKLVLKGSSTTQPPAVAFPGRPGSPAQLKVAITEMSPGSAGGRMFAGELGMGHAWVQIEGTVTDPRTQTVLVSFADRRRSSGAIGLEDLAGDAGPSLVKRMIEEIGEDIRLELRSVFE